MTIQSWNFYNFGLSWILILSYYLLKTSFTSGFKYADAFADYINSLDEVKNPNESPGLQVWVSVLQRTNQTAARIQAPVLCWNALTELDAGDFDGKSMDYIKKNYPFEFERRQDDKFRYR